MSSGSPVALYLGKIVGKRANGSQSWACVSGLHDDEKTWLPIEVSVPITEIQEQRLAVVRRAESGEYVVAAVVLSQRTA